MERMLRRVEPPPAWEVVRELRVMADDRLVAFALGAWAKEGLLALADHYLERGMDDLARFWRRKVVELGEVHIADTALALTVADGLRDLAECYKDLGYLLLWLRWIGWAEFVQARAWQRVRVAHGVV